MKFPKPHTIEQIASIIGCKFIGDKNFPVLGINEIPSANTIIGGFLILMAILYYSLLIKQNRRFIGLN